MYTPVCKKCSTAVCVCVGCGEGGGRPRHVYRRLLKDPGEFSTDRQIQNNADCKNVH